MVFCGESIITEISVYVSFYMSEFIIQSTNFFIKPDNHKQAQSKKLAFSFSRLVAAGFYIITLTPRKVNHFSRRFS